MALMINVATNVLVPELLGTRATSRSKGLCVSNVITDMLLSTLMIALVLPSGT